MDLNDVEVRDFGTIVNSLMHGPSVPADVSFHVRWSGVKNRVHPHDEQNELSARVIEDNAPPPSSAQRQGFKFFSDPPKSPPTTFAYIRHHPKCTIIPD